MAKQDAERFPIGRTALGGASCGFTYDAAVQDAVARESRLRRPLRLDRWRPGPSPDPRSLQRLEQADPPPAEPSA